jgi:hypothetical protein
LVLNRLPVFLGKSPCFRAKANATCFVLIGLRIAEIDQHTVAHVFRHEAAEAPHRLGNAFLIGGQAELSGSGRDAHFRRRCHHLQRSQPFNRNRGDQLQIRRLVRMGASPRRLVRCRYFILDGIGVFAPQYGPRRGYFLGVSKKF